MVMKGHLKYSMQKNRIPMLGRTTIYKDEVSYYLTRLYYVLDMADYYDSLQEYLDNKFGYNWIYEDLDTLEKAIKEWIQWEDEQLDKEIEEYWRKTEEKESKSNRKKKHQWSVKEIKPCIPIGYKGFTEWNEIGDDTYLEDW